MEGTDKKEEEKKQEKFESFVMLLKGLTRTEMKNKESRNEMNTRR